MAQWNARVWRAFLIALSITVLVGIAASFAPRSLDVQFIEEQSVNPIETFYAEQNERLMYVLCVPAFPIAFFCAYLLLGRRKQQLDEQPRLLPWLPFLAVAVISLLSARRIGQYISCYGDHPWLISGILCALLAIAAAALWYLLFFRKNASLRTGWYWGAAIALSAVIALTYVTNTYLPSDACTFHVDAYFFPVYRILKGYTMYIDFSTQYGQYAYLLAPLFKLLGASMSSFSVLMTSLVFLCCMLAAGVLRRFCKNALVALIGFVGVVFVMFVYARAGRLSAAQFYLQYAPHRMLFPLLVLYCGALALTCTRERLRRAAIPLGYLLGAIGIFWNFETGAVALLTFFLLQVYLAAARYCFSDRRFWRSLLCNVGLAVGAAALYLLLTWGVAFLRTGQSVDLAETLLSVSVFYNMGFYMLPMPLWHPWMLLALLYMSALANGVRRLRVFHETSEAEARQSAALILLAVLGLGVFSYYQGRSHDRGFVPVLYPAILLVTVYADRLLPRLQGTPQTPRDACPLRAVTQNPRVLHGFLLGTLLTVLALALPFTFATEPKMRGYLRYDGSDPNAYFQQLVDTLAERDLDANDIDLVLDCSDLLYLAMDCADPLPSPNPSIWFFYDDVRSAYAYLERSTRRYVIVDGFTEPLFDRCIGEDWHEGWREETMVFGNARFVLYDRAG